MRLTYARSQIRIQQIVEFLLIRGLILLFLFHLIDLLFGRVLASVREAKLRLCVRKCTLLKKKKEKKQVI